MTLSSHTHLFLVFLLLGTLVVILTPSCLGKHRHHPPAAVDSTEAMYRSGEGGGEGEGSGRGGGSGRGEGGGRGGGRGGGGGKGGGGGRGGGGGGGGGWDKPPEEGRRHHPPPSMQSSGEVDHVEPEAATTNPTTTANYKLPEKKEGVFKASPVSEEKQPHDLERPCKLHC